MKTIFRYLAICVVLALGVGEVMAQQISVSEIKDRGDIYIWGEGVGKTRQIADNAALQMLISQISVSVETDFEWMMSEEIVGDDEVYMEMCKSLVSSYSSTTLSNAEMMVWGDVPEITVFRYIRRSDIAKIFEMRKSKIIDYARIAKEAERGGNIADALKYYYWSLLLLQSHPQGNLITYTQIDYQNEENSIENELLYAWLPRQIDGILGGLKINVVGSKSSGNLHTYNINILYNGGLVSSCDYSYFNSNSWSNLTGAKDGLGVVELVGDKKLMKSLDIKVEYQFEDKMKIDPEVANIFNIQSVTAPIFSNNKFSVSLQRKDQERRVEQDVTGVIEAAVAHSEAVSSESTDSFGVADNRSQIRKHSSVIDDIVKAIGKKRYSSVREDFTENGYDVFTRLIGYGNARCLDPKADFSFVECGGKMVCRSIPMSFNFVNNNRTFVENVVFHFDENGKVDDVTFALDANTVDEVFSCGKWDSYVSWVVVDFMEHYQTAYALERIDYLNSIFDDNALIIVGSVLKMSQSGEVQLMKNNPVVKRTQVSKQDYISNLRRVFQNNEYINIKLVDVKVQKATRGDALFGIQVCQDYYSANYGDKGYLFLMVDLKDRERPNILVRTWQPEPDPDFGVVGLSHF